MSLKPPAPGRALLRGVLGVVLLAGPALLGAGPARAEDCCSHHCPPPYVHCMERPPCIKFKCACPRPVCPPCDSPFFGYYPTCWRCFPGNWSNCPERNPPWVAVAPGVYPPGSAAPGATMPPADSPEATAPELMLEGQEVAPAPAKDPRVQPMVIPGGRSPVRQRLESRGPATP